MIEVTIEIKNGGTSFVTAVRAESIGRALQIVGGLNPDGDFRVAFPIDPETFFVKDPTATVGQIEPAA